MSYPRIEMQGRTFGRLQVLDMHSLADNCHRRWTCLCACGNTTVVRGPDLRSGATQSCGCLRRERVTQRNLDGAARTIRQAGQQRQATV